MFCRAHETRWRMQGRPEVEGFIARCLLPGRDRIDFSEQSPSSSSTSASTIAKGVDHHHWRPARTLGDDLVRGRPTRPVTSLEPGDHLGVCRASGDPGQLACAKGGERLAFGRGALLQSLGDLVRDIAEVENRHATNASTLQALGL